MTPLKRVALLSDSSALLHPGSRKLSGNIHRLLADGGLAIAYSTTYLRAPREADFAAIGRLDAVVLNGEGGLHHSAERPKVNRLLSGAVALARAKGCPLILINATVEALDAAALDALKAFDLVVVRDGESANYLEPVIGRPRLVPDLSLAYEVTPPAVRPSGTLITDSVVPEVHARLKEIAAHAGLPFMEMDPRVIAGPLYRVRKWPLVRQHLERKSRPADILARFAAAESVLTGRFHGLMFALLTRRPFRAIQSNTGKIASALTDALGNDARHVSIDAALTDDPAALTAVPPFTPDEEAALDAYLARARTGAAEMMADVRALIGA